MSEAKIKVREDIYLSSVTPADKPALLEHFETRDVYLTTLNIPYPYSESDADWWINKRIAKTSKRGIEATFAIRDAGKLIGVLGADDYEGGTTHRRAEIGYWLAKSYWGSGLMTDALRAFVNYAFDRLDLLRLTAHVFDFNLASARVLEKNGFILEGLLRKHFCKDGKVVDARIYGLLKDER